MEKPAPRGYNGHAGSSPLLRAAQGHCGQTEDAAELSDGARVEDLFARYGERYPELAAFRGSVVASINQTFADWRSPLAAGDEVAFLPPVSGGGETSGVALAEDLSSWCACRFASRRSWRTEGARRWRCTGV